MFYEGVTIARGDTISRLAAAYGYKDRDWGTVWNDPRNSPLSKHRGAPEKISAGDTLLIPIPWRVVHKAVVNEHDGASIVLERDGELGQQLSWVQTVYRGNQPAGPNPSPFCVDGCTPDDDLPFYWTNGEIAANPTLRKLFKDHSARPAPTVAMGTTTWRAVVSLAVVTKKRVTIWNSQVWGWDMTPANAVTTIGPRAARETEIFGHLTLLRNGLGTGPMKFKETGWTFRAAPD
jgi:hypothetical protein